MIRVKGEMPLVGPHHRDAFCWLYLTTKFAFNHILLLQYQEKVSDIHGVIPFVALGRFIGLSRGDDSFHLYLKFKVIDKM
jgi:hypothetical protein